LGAFGMERDAYFQAFDAERGTAGGWEKAFFAIHFI
jgi:hypothetical protein